jgi:GntR family transcriptional regulator
VTRTLAIDPTDAVPIWKQIEDGVRRLVVAGVLEPGTAVPSVRELARELRVNPATVSKAYQRLTDAGVLEVRRGEGTFVADRPVGLVAAERRDLLADEARRYAEAVAAMGASREEAEQAVRAALAGLGEAVVEVDHDE